ncbi:TPA: hypothetical protein R1705_001707, partial [Campylobacter coli]|nr:hypothetical protein [Campylobacter coli]
MKAYIHIGTAKTGTTTLQEFLFLNKNLKDYIFLTDTFLGVKNHSTLAVLGYEKTYRDGYTRNKKIFTDEDLILHQEKIIENLSSKIEKQQRKIIFSSELIQLKLSYQNILKFKKSLKRIGFKEIKIIIYLREYLDLFRSLSVETIRHGGNGEIFYKEAENSFWATHICNHKQTLQWWGEIFGKENLIVRLFDNNEFYQGDLLKDFIHSIGLEWDDEFIIPPKQNESLDLLGIELLRRVNSISSRYTGVQPFIKTFCEKHFTSKDPHLKFQPPKEIMQSYINYFEESNEWVRQEFFPHKERLFPKKDLSNYKENYELKEMKPEYWDKIAEFIADIVKTKNQNIADKTNIIQNKDKIIIDQTTQIKS